MKHFAPLAFLSLTAAAPEKVTTAAQVIGAAKPDVGLLDHGQLGIILYAVLLVIFLLLMVIGVLLWRDIRKDGAWQRLIDKMASAAEKSASAEATLASAVASFSNTMARVEVYLDRKSER